jgi:hypothetical protein
MTFSELLEETVLFIAALLAVVIVDFAILRNSQDAFHLLASWVVSAVIFFGYLIYRDPANGWVTFHEIRSDQKKVNLDGSSLKERGRIELWARHVFVPSFDRCLAGARLMGSASVP